MSRIEKGSQRFRPTVVSRRTGTANADTNGMAQKPPAVAIKPAVEPPEAGGPSQSEPASATPNTRRIPTSIQPAAGPARSYAFKPSTAPRTIVPRARGSAPPVVETTVGQPAERTPTDVRPSITPRAPSLITPKPSGFAPERNDTQTSSTPDGYASFLQAAQADPTILQLDPAMPSNDVAASAAVVWQEMSEDQRRSYYSALNTTPDPPTRRTPRAPGKRRNTTTISDDEAEYNAQCAAQTHAASNQDNDGDIPPLRVDVGATTMESIAVTNWKSGRASSRTFELERVRARQLKKRRQDAQAIKENPEQSPAPETLKSSGTPAPLEEEQANQQPEEHPPEEEFGENRFAVQTRIVDGKIVLDEQSLFANYRDDEQQAREQRNWEVVDERESDQFVNSASRSKQRRTQRWSAEETERFFQAVSQWGTDFEMITRLFPHRTRREIKSKWTKESRQNSKRLDDAFVRRTAIDLTAYGNATGVDLSGPPPVIEPKAQDIRLLQKDEGA